MGWNSQGALNFLKDRDLKKEKEEERALERENALFALTLESMKARNKFRTGEKYTSAIDANRVLRKGIMEADLTAEDLAFYEPILEDPFASKFVRDFMKKRADQGLKITYSMVPSMLDVIPSNAPEAEKIDFIERITGADLSGEKGKKIYRELATEIISAPTQIQSTLLISPKPGTDLNVKNKDLYQKAQREKIEAQVIPLAKMKLKRDIEQYGIEDTRVQNLQALLNDLERGGDGANRAFNLLMPMVLTKQSFELLIKNFSQDFIGYEENPYLPNIGALFPDLEE